MSQFTDLAMGIAVGLGLLSGCAPGGSSSGGPDTLNCQGDPSQENTVEQCVVFAQATTASSPGDGSRAHPFSSLQAAIDTASSLGKRVFACNAGTFKEAVVLDAPIELWGGFDCDHDWHYSSTGRTTLEGPPDKVGITVSKKGAGALVVGWIVKAGKPEMPGGSSIAVAVDAVDKHTFLWRLDLFATDGNDGQDGDPPGGPAKAGGNAASAGAMGQPSNACVDASARAGGEPGTVECDDGKGAGGTGALGGAPPSGPGNDGTDGAPVPMPNAGLGKGGTGESDASPCTAGLVGADGTSGTAGKGADTYGTALITGIKPVDGKPGAPGGRGQGGGGGGAAMAGMFCKAGASTVAGFGASGGGGGAGGCGGKGGNPGKSGGSSIGVIALSGKVRLIDITVTTGRGGKGGDGAAGQVGGHGGNGANGGASSGLAGSTDGCAGGKGGKGGDGGPGGGGRGGHSVGVVYTTPVPLVNVTQFIGNAGKGGKPGPGGNDDGYGLDGVRDEQHPFGGL
jgi:hypothetical protein